MLNYLSNFNMSIKGILIFWTVSLVIFLVFLIIFATRISNGIKAYVENNGRINQYLAAVPSDKIGTINAVYQNTRKHLSGALLLCIVGGTFGFQRIYLGKKSSAVTMFLFFWTGIPTIISIFDLTMMPKTVSEFNLGVVESLYNQIAAPKLEN